MSLFRHIYDQTVVPTLMTAFAENSVIAFYRIGNSETEIRLIDRGERIEIEMDSEGDEIKRRRKQVVICTDPDSPWGGVADPQLTGQIEIGGVAWNISPSAGQAAESVTGSFAVLNLVRSAGVSKSYQGSRKD